MVGVGLTVVEEGGETEVTVGVGEKERTCSFRDVDAERVWKVGRERGPRRQRAVIVRHYLKKC
jgi:hypothetical protein